MKLTLKELKQEIDDINRDIYYHMKEVAYLAKELEKRKDQIKNKNKKKK